MAESKERPVTGLSAEDQQRQLETLCMDLEAGGLSAESFAQLEELLLDNPELQDAYCQLISLSHLLRVELQGRQYPSLLSHLTADAGSAAADAANCRPCQPGEMATQLAEAPTRSRFWGLLMVAAASVAILCGYAIEQRTDGWRTTAPEAPLAELDFESPAMPNLRPEYIALRSHEAIDLLHRVTNASWQSPPRSPALLKEDFAVTMTQGTAQLNPFNGLPAGGYVAVLPPGAELELTVFADSDGENTLAVMELDQQGLPTGQLASFSNQSRPQAAESTRLYGQIGTWSERNSGGVDKFYLLTGMQQVPEPQHEPSWYVADCKVLVNLPNLPNLLHIGWDDTGWVTDTTDKSRRDKDFNDIAATIRIRRPGESRVARSPKVRTFPALDEPVAFLDSEKSQLGFPLTVAPGQRVIFSASSSSRLPNSLTVVDRETGRIWWQCGSGVERQPQLGAYVVENHTSKGLSLALLGRYQHSEAADDSDAEWLPSTFQVLVDDQRCQMVGFEDLGIDNDWDDLRVNVHWIPD